MFPSALGDRRSRAPVEWAARDGTCEAETPGARPAAASGALQEGPLSPPTACRPAHGAPVGHGLLEVLVQEAPGGICRVECLSLALRRVQLVGEVSRRAGSQERNEKSWRTTLSVSTASQTQGGFTTHRCQPPWLHPSPPQKEGLSATGSLGSLDSPEVTRDRHLTAPPPGHVVSASRDPGPRTVPGPLLLVNPNSPA